MITSFADDSPTKKSLTVEVPAEEVRRVTERIARTLAKNVDIPGFRRGKIPLELIKRRFAEALKGEVVDQLVEESVTGALKERKDLPDGYAYRFEPGVVKEVGEWIQIVAKCCQPLTYEVSLEPQPRGALWVRITGHDSKEFIGLEFAPLTQKLAAKDGHR